jgi:STE24 endopeptidase
MSDSNYSRDEMARECDAIHNRLFLLQVLALGALLALYQFSGASVALAQGLELRFGHQWGATNAVYTLISVFGFSACMFPFSYYGGHVLELHYELSDDTFGEWFGDFIKTLLIDLILSTVLFSVIYALLRWIPELWWLAAAAFYILFTGVLSTIAPHVIMLLFHKVKPLREGVLTGAIRKMMDEVGMPGVGVFKWELEDHTGAASVAFAGFGKNRRIIMSDALLAGYTQQEILALLAHEVGHYKNRDTLRLTITSSLLALLGFYIAHHCLVALVDFFGLAGIENIAAAPAFIFCLFIFSLISMPVANLHSRHLEFAADAYAIETLGSSDALVSACEKLADENLTSKEPPAWAEFLLHGHPSISRRIERARNHSSSR